MSNSGELLNADMGESNMSKLIVIDGLDGCGKETQTKLLKSELEGRGYTVKTISFPDYDSESSALVKMYLRGDLGSDARSINPYVAGSFYTLDRAIQYLTDFRKYCTSDSKTVILADRYTSANVIHQASKISDRTERHRYIDWMMDFEYIRCRLPIEDITIVLSLEPKTSQMLLSNRYKGDDSKRDIHENDVEYLKTCHRYLEDSVEFINECNNGSYYHKRKTWVRLQCDIVDYDKSSSEEIVYAGADTIDHIHENIMWYVNKILNNEKIGRNYLSHMTQLGLPDGTSYKK